MDLLIFSLIQLACVLGLCVITFIAGWVEANNWRRQQENDTWRLIHRVVNKEQEYWVYLNQDGSEFKVTYGIDNCVLTGVVPHIYNGLDNEILVKYIVDTYHIT